MNTKKITFTRNNILCTGYADYFDKTDIEQIKKTYFAWKALNEVYVHYNIRRANFPELLSEGLTSIIFNWGRTNSSNIQGLPSNSMDLIDTNTGEMIQLKSCSTDSVHSAGPTSFGPTSEFDRLIFMHMDCANDTAYWYELKSEDYKDWKVNKTETIGIQQAQGKRPRLVILPKIKEYNLVPIMTFKF